MILIYYTADLWLNEDSYEKAHKVLFEEACQKAIEKAGIQKEQIQFLLGGDLNQSNHSN